MAEAMSEEQLAEIRAIADRDRWSTYCGHAGPRAIVTDLLDEVDRLRAQLAEIGETREEWSVRWHEDGDVTVSRIVGKWREVKQESDRG